MKYAATKAILMRILVYASVRLFGESLAACLGEDEAVTEVRVKHNAHDLTRALDEFEADVILFDVTRKSEVQLVRQLLGKSPRTPLVALAVPAASSDVIACADAGFVSYVPRNASLDELSVILKMAIRGEASCDPKITRSLFEEIYRRRGRNERQRTRVGLTPRETETMGLVSSGLSNKEIAHEMHVSVATVKNHVHAVLQKLRLTRRTEVRQLVTDQPWILLGGARELASGDAVLS